MLLGLTDSIANSCALLEPKAPLGPVVLPDGTTDTTLAVAVSVRSRSPTVNVPLLVTAAFVSVTVPVSLLPLATVIVGPSLLPVTVIVTVVVALSGVAAESVALTV
jgi:hypothetical protein